MTQKGASHVAEGNLGGGWLADHKHYATLMLLHEKAA
jgi:hypothetical protein